MVSSAERVLASSHTRRARCRCPFTVAQLAQLSPTMTLLYIWRTQPFRILESGSAQAVLRVTQPKRVRGCSVSKSTSCAVEAGPQLVEIVQGDDSDVSGLLLERLRLHGQLSAICNTHINTRPG